MTIENGHAYLTKLEQRLAERAVDSRARFTRSTLALVLAYLDTAPATSEAEYWELLDSAVKANVERQARYRASLAALIEAEQKDGRWDFAERLQHVLDEETREVPI